MSIRFTTGPLASGMTYGPHPHSHRSRRVHRARSVGRPMGLASLVILAVWTPPFFFAGFAIGARLLSLLGAAL